jgi:hypothetical protein
VPWESTIIIFWDGADHGDAHLVRSLAHQLERVDQAGQRDGGRALLVVVPDRDRHLFAQPVQDVEALGLFDIFQVDPAKDGL